MAVVVKCPDDWRAVVGVERAKALFLGGGITGVGDWQAEMTEMLKDTTLTLVNPRRDDFDVNNPAMSANQIAWEADHLAFTRMRLFWFPPETLCPITLFELGRWCKDCDPLFVGCHPEYRRAFDVIEQMKHHRPRLTVVSSLGALAVEVVRHHDKYFGSST